MTTFTGSPRTLRGGFVVMDAEGRAVQRTIAFQFNPDTLTRTLTPRGAAGAAGDGRDAVRLVGPPAETMKFEIELEAMNGPKPEKDGVVPDLSTLETLFTPRVADITAGARRAAAGTLEILPLPAPLVLLVLGALRVLPVRITEFSVVEEAFDVKLSPIRARASIGVSVLTVDDLAWGSKGAELHLAALSRREKMAGSRTAALSALGLTAAP